VVTGGEKSLRRQGGGENQNTARGTSCRGEEGHSAILAGEKQEVGTVGSMLCHLTLENFREWILFSLTCR
jgi:hypothetical protein